jgi:hypothetical protein
MATDGACAMEIEVSPLRESSVMLEKLDTLLPIFASLAEELEDLRRALGNGEFEYKFRVPAED